MIVDKTDMVMWEDLARRDGTRSHIYPQLGRYKSDEFLKLVRRWINFNSRIKILKTDLREEAYGEDEILFSLPDGHDIYGVDISASTVNRAADVMKKKGFSHEYIEADVRELPFADSSFDVVISTSTLDHFSDDACLSAALSELNRVLKADGMMIATFNNGLNANFRIFNAIEKLMHISRYPVKYFTRNKLLYKMNVADFQCDEFEYTTNIVSPANSILRVSRAIFGKRTTDFVASRMLKFADILHRLPLINNITAWFIAVKCTKKRLR